MKKVLAGGAVALALAFGGIGSAQAADVGGNYLVQGTNFDGSVYTGTARIKRTSDTTCEIVWDTGSTSQGICMRNGPAFAAGYSMGSSVGLVIYRILPNGVLDGVWTIAGQSGAGTEVLTPR
ncbi:hypothetical protein [Zavarzinia sp. CC-PAN008]|uniref:hypothetical protein n=1 Tax=Zavarzinia sp. CC-PAN008 TaxID=3243332 RepID=UPI003F744BA7